MSHVFPRHCQSQPPVAIGGEGVWLIDAEGNRYLDGSGGAAVSVPAPAPANCTRMITPVFLREQPGSAQGPGGVV